MANLTEQEIDILNRTKRAIRWRCYVRWFELALGIGFIALGFWMANDRVVFEWFVGGGGIFGLLGGLGGSATISALRNWGHSRNKLLVKLSKQSDTSVTQQIVALAASGRLQPPRCSEVE